jgi:hypothetical protein
MGWKSLGLAVSGLFLAAGVSVAAPADPAHVGDLLVAAAKATAQAELAYAAANADGGVIIVSDVRVAVPSRNGTIAVPKVAISGAVERPGGGFTAATIAFDGGSATIPLGTVTWQTASMADAIVPSADEVAARSRGRPFRTLTLSGVKVDDAEGGDPITIDSVTVDVADIVEGSPTAFTVHATGARVPTAFIANPIVGAMLTRLGYEAIAADVTLAGEYDMAADTVSLKPLTIDAAEVGKIAVTAKFSGMSVGDLSDPEKSKEARAAARLDAMTVRFDDAGFVARMLEMQAGMMGGTADDVRAQLVYGALPFALSFVDNESFRQSFQTAIESFLADPHSLTITASPSAPVPLGQVMRTALRKPLDLPDLLSPDVVANR